MTLEEAKNILKEEGFTLEGPGKKTSAVSEAFTEYESPYICEAMQTVCSAGYMIMMFGNVFEARKERLKKEYEKNTKAPGPGEEQPKEKKGIIYPTTFPKADFYHKHVLNEGNPALEEAASQFNDALLDEQAKKIAELTKENERLERVSKTATDEFNELYYKMITKSDKIEALGKEIARLNKIIHKKNLKIEELGKESSRHLKGKMKLFGENFDLEQTLKDKDAVLSDVAEELRLSKIREKNLTELCQKYVKEVEDLREKLADNVVDKIDAQALKSAESALAWKEKVIYYKDMAIAYNEKKIAEKDEVIDNLRKELKAQEDLVDDISLKCDGAKHNLKLCMDECDKLKKELYEAKMRQQQAYRSCADKNKDIEALKLQISAWEKRGNGIDWKRNADAIKLYVNRASRERLWNTVTQDICNEKELSFIINHGGKRTKYALRFDGTDIVYECSDPDKKPSIFRDDSVGAVTNLKDCSLAKDTVDIAEEGGDHSEVIVLCGKDFIDAIKKME